MFNTNAQVKVDSPSGMAVYADSNPPPMADMNGRDGWLFSKNSVSNGKFNYYMWAQGSQAITLSRVDSIAFRASIDTYTNISSVPFLTIYTKPTGVGDAGAFYHSRITYTVTNTPLISLGESCVFYAESLPLHSEEYRDIPLHNKIVTGDGLPTEEILYVTIHSDSGAANNTQILISDFSFKTNHSTAVDLRLRLVA